MIPTKAYIIRISDELSQEYAKIAANSCVSIGLEYEFVEGVQNKTAYDAWVQSGLNVKMIGIYKTHKIDKAACASVSHALIWDKISKGKEAAIILEHDAVMLHRLDLDIPDHTIVTLGYKTTTPDRYNHIAAGPPNKLTAISGHEGAHSYAITPVTATQMINELRTNGISMPVDNTFFLPMRSSKTKLSIADPTPAIGWIRKSTIWAESSTVNCPYIDSFSKYFIQ